MKGMTSFSVCLLQYNDPVVGYMSPSVADVN